LSTTLAVNAGNDIYRDAAGNIALASGVVALMQNAQQAAQTLLGELIYATDQGLPNFQTIWNGAPNVPLWTEYLRRTLQGVNGVTKVQSLTVTRVQDEIKYSTVLETVYGLVELNG
jgi:hypothetical protein